MATTTLYGKTCQKSSPEPAGRFPRNLVCSFGPIIVCSNYDPRELESSMLYVKFQDHSTSGSGEDFKDFYHIWAWRPSWSCDLDHLYKRWFPLPKEALHKMLL